MKYLGVDFGSKRIGLAFSDDSGGLAFPLKVLENSEKAVSEILRICKDKNIGTVVVGDSKDYKFQDNDIMKEIKIFAEEIKKESELSVVFHPEFLTSQEAMRLQGKNDMLDASAAAIILKSYLASRCRN
jgi:putative Holliday junction resolvase